MVACDGIRIDLGIFWVWDIVFLGLNFLFINLLNGDDNNSSGD